MFGPLRIGSLVYGAWNQRKNNKKAGKEADAMNKRIDASEARYKRQEADLSNMFNNEYYKGALDNEYAQSALKKIREGMKTAADRDDKTAVITGQSDEAKIAAKEKRYGTMSDAITSLAGYGAQRKDRLFSDYWNRKMDFNNLYGSIDQRRDAASGMKLDSLNNSTANTWGAIGAVNESMENNKEELDSLIKGLGGK